MNAIPDPSTIDLQFRLPGPPPSNAAGQPRKRQGLFRQAGKEVLQLGQFHLDLPILSMSPLGEDIQDQLGPVQDPEFGSIGDRGHLPGC